MNHMSKWKLEWEYNVSVCMCLIKPYMISLLLFEIFVRLKV